MVISCSMSWIGQVCHYLNKCPIVVCTHQKTTWANFRMHITDFSKCALFSLMSSRTIYFQRGYKICCFSWSFTVRQFVPNKKEIQTLLYTYLFCTYLSNYIISLTKQWTKLFNPSILTLLYYTLVTVWGFYIKTNTPAGNLNVIPQTTVECHFQICL